LAGKCPVPLWRDGRGQGAQYKKILHCPILTGWPEASISIWQKGDSILYLIRVRSNQN
jgi:hypothetical protein